MNSKEITQKLFDDDLFLQWKQQHPQFFLTHFFCSINAQSVPITGWEIGFFDPKTQKITVFALLENNSFEVRPADDIFAKQPGDIEELEQSKVKLTFEDAAAIWKQKLPEYFANEQVGNGFVILQTYQKQTVWNVTFITKTLRFINLKIDANTAQVYSHDTINLVQK